jgi:hypothetical protein
MRNFDSSLGIGYSFVIGHSSVVIPRSGGNPQSSHSFVISHSSLVIPRSGAVLLEIILALSLFFVAAAFVTGSLHTSFQAAGNIKLSAQGADLAVTKMTELQLQPEKIIDSGPEPFATEEPMSLWTWQVVTAPLELPAILQGPALKRVEVIIRNPSRQFTYRLVEQLPVSDAASATTEPAGVLP